MVAGGSQLHVMLTQVTQTSCPITDLRHGCFAQIAAALQAEKLILMTDVPGVLKDKNDINTKYTSLDIRECRELTDQGIIAGGMIPKVKHQTLNTVCKSQLVVAGHGGSDLDMGCCPARSAHPGSDNKMCNLL